MNGGDLGAIAQNVMVYFGGPAGAYIGAAAGIVCYLLAAAHLLSPRHAWTTMGCVMGAWTVAFCIRQFVGWA